MTNSMTLKANNSISYSEINGTMMDRFINYLDVSERTISTYKRSLKQFAKFLQDNEIRQPARADILTYKAELMKRCKPATVTAYITAVKLFFRWTEQERLYPNIAENIKGSKLSKEHKKDYLTVEQIREVLRNMEQRTEKGKRDFAILTLMLTCGLRTVEVVRANIEDLTVLGGHSVLYIQGKGKTDKADFVKIPAGTEKAIRRYLQGRTDRSGTEPLFASVSNNNAGQRMTTRAISGIVKGSFKAVGLDSDRLTAHSTRHTAVTLALLAGNSLEEVQQFARHSNIATTQIYAHNIDKLNGNCENSIASAIF